MATVRHNVVAEDLDGMLGDQLVFKKDMAGRTIISYKPNFDENRTFSPAQQAQQEAFREAMAHGKSAKDNSVYVEKAQGTTKAASGTPKLMVSAQDLQGHIAQMTK